MSEKHIAGGAWVQVKIMVEDAGGVKKLQSIGLASGCSYDEDWGIQPANVLNHLGPISLDSQNYSCNINLSSFVPERKSTLYKAGDGGEITPAQILPIRDDIQADGKGKSFDQIVFVNTATGEVMNQFEQATLASNGTQVSPNSYVSSNMRFMAVKRSV